jgi:hypothetical protein
MSVWWLETSENHVIRSKRWVIWQVQRFVIIYLLKNSSLRVNINKLTELLQ